MKKLLALITLLAAGNLFAQLAIKSVSPDSADPGTMGLTVTFTLPDSTPPTPPVANTPNSVMIGSISGTSITRVSLDTVTAVFDIPADEAEGAKKCAITFTVPSGEVEFTKSSGFTVGGSDSSYTNGPAASGYSLYSSNTSTNTYLIDNDENIVKTWTSSYAPGQSVYLLDDGSLMRTANTGSTTFNEGGTAGRVEQYDWDGNLIWAYDYDTDEHRSHHDIEVLPSGNILMLAWEKKTEAEALAAGRSSSLLDDGELWPDTVIEVAPTGSYGGTIVWEWHVWDHITTNGAANPEKIDINYTQSGPNDGNADWNHCNAVDYNEELDQILISSRNFSEIWIIDHNTTTEEAAGSAGDLLYRWGNPATYGDLGDQQLYVQHNAHWIDDDLPGGGDILIFNNGQGRPDGNYSSVVEIVPPLAADGSYTNGLPLEPTWIYTNSVATNFYASRISGAQRQKNGNTLICEGTKGYAFEVTEEGGLVWDFTGSGEIFRFERYSPDFPGFGNTELALPTVPYAVVDTSQTLFFDESDEISEPGTNDAFYGQDAQFDGYQPCYEISSDRLTVYDYNTRMTWTRSPDWTGDGTIDIDDKMTQSEAAAYVDTVNAANFGGYSDWRLPTTKEVYSLMDFRGTDPMSDDTSTLVPFIDSDYFEFAWGDTNAGERTIDSQVATSTIDLDPVMGGMVDSMPGLNIVDGRIKGYPITKDFLVYLCRGNTEYGVNDYQDNGDGTVTDRATGLMWQQTDSGTGLLWSNALAYVQQKNAENYLGHSDWRIPNAKELQSIVNYDVAPTTTGCASIDTNYLYCTTILNEGGETDWPWYYTGTTHVQQDGSGDHAVYVCFGRAMGYYNDTWEDVHGAGAQRSETKSYDTTGYTYITDGWYYTTAPQGDAARWYNYVRLVRDADLTVSADPSVYYVDADTPADPGEQDGTSWDTAFEDLQDALALATTQEIWVAAGIYYPDEAAAGFATVTDGDPDSHFQIPENGSIYGGFDGTETSREERDVAANKTVLSGDIDQNDTTDSYGVLPTPDGNIVGTNALSVVFGNWGLTCLLDGVTITGGDGGEAGGFVGGGKYRQCTIQGNYGKYAGGRYGEGDPLSLVECDFINNVGEYVGGVDSSSVEGLIIESCRFVGNRSMRNHSHSAGALTLGYEDMGLTNCLFAGNSGLLIGGICIQNSGSFQLVNCTIAGNTASETNASYTGAGGVNADSNVVLMLCNSIIWGNSAPENDNAVGIDTQTYSVVEGRNVLGSGNLNTDPLFSDSDYHLAYASPCINAGDNSAVVVSEDLDGNDRIYYDPDLLLNYVDMGCYETFDDGTDTDGDSLTDYEEGVDYGTDPERADTDGDGSSDGDEIFIGSSPTEESSVFEVSMTLDASGDMQFSWPKFSSGRLYELMGCTNLVDGSWFSIGSTTSSNLTRSITNSAVFYRVEVTEDPAQNY